MYKGTGLYKLCGRCPGVLASIHIVKFTVLQQAKLKCLRHIVWEETCAEHIMNNKSV